MRKPIITLAILFFSQLTFAATPQIGTMSGEARDYNERIDIKATIDALVQMHANTFYYLIWQNKQDWNDLPAFCDAAAQHGIEVWPYIAPWSETPPKKVNGWGYSEPFRNDYISWAEAIAKLSLEHPNVPGYVIDDFYDNTEEGHFTPNFVKRMVAAGRHINPNIKFYPLMYPQTPWIEFTNRFGAIIDGVVACYPKSDSGIRNAWMYLNDRPHGQSAMVELGRHKGAARGDGASVSGEVNIVDPESAEITFYYDVTDDIDGDTSLQDVRVKLNGNTVWQAPTEGRMRDGLIHIDLRRFVHRPGRLRVQFDVITVRTGVPERLPVQVRFDDIRVYGVTHDRRDFSINIGLKGTPFGKFEADILPGGRGEHRFSIPMVLMPSGEGEQYQKRYNARPSPQLVAAKVKLSLDAMQDGLATGVVPYRTPMYPGDPYFEAVRREFLNLSQPAPAR